jgi:hypothetical protein
MEEVDGLFVVVLVVFVVTIGLVKHSYIEKYNVPATACRPNTFDHTVFTLLLLPLPALCCCNKDAIPDGAVDLCVGVNPIDDDDDCDQ